MRRRVTVMNEVPLPTTLVSLHATAQHGGVRAKHFWLSSTPARRSGHGIMHVQLLPESAVELGPIVAT